MASRTAGPLAAAASAALLLLLAAPAARGQLLPAGFQSSQFLANQAKSVFSARLRSGATVSGGGRTLFSDYDGVDRANYDWNRNGQGNKAAVLPTTQWTFTGGRATVVHSGIYILGGSARCDNQACDVTISVDDSTRVAGFGTDLVERIENALGAGWASHSVVTIMYLNAGQTISLWMESGASDDRILETGFYYGHLWANLIISDTQTG